MKKKPFPISFGNGFYNKINNGEFMIITSRENKIFKLAKLLKTAKGRSEKELFLIEGIRSVRDAIEKNADIDCILLKDGTSLDFNVDCDVYTFAPKLPYLVYNVLQLLIEGLALIPFYM